MSLTSKPDFLKMRPKLCTSTMIGRVPKRTISHHQGKLPQPAPTSTVISVSLHEPTLFLSLIMDHLNPKVCHCPPLAPQKGVHPEQAAAKQHSSPGNAYHILGSHYTCDTFIDRRHHELRLTIGPEPGPMQSEAVPSIFKWMCEHRSFGYRPTTNC